MPGSGLWLGDMGGRPMELEVCSRLVAVRVLAGGVWTQINQYVLNGDTRANLFLPVVVLNAVQWHL